MSGSRHARVAAVLLGAALIASPVPALAAGWSWPVRGPVTLPFGSSWTDAAGRRCTHGGIDIAADAGSEVVAPCTGAVSFAGLVPAGAGRRAWAVTLLTASGDKVTCMPLASVGVRAGESAGAGEPIGTLASDGDASSSGSHLHLGVHRGAVLLDPLPMLDGSPVGGGGSAPTPVPAPSAAPKPLGSPGLPVASPRPAESAPTRVRARVRARVGAPSGALSPAGAQAVARVSGAPARVLGRAPALSTLPHLPSAGALDLVRAASDVIAARDRAAGVLLRLAVAVAGLACVRPLARALAASGRAAAVRPLPLPRERA